MSTLPFDLETVPSQQAWVRQAIADNIKPPGNIKKQESIDKWMEEKAPAAIDEALAKTSFNGGVGEIICIGYAFDDEPAVVNGRKLEESEGDMLQNFADAIAVNMNSGHTKNDQYEWVGHYICGFDLHFLWQRMIVNGIKSPIEIPHTAKPWHSGVFDTCHEWKMDTSGFGSLGDVCKILGIEQAPDDIKGSEVWGMIQAGNYEKVFEHCRLDVEDTRKVYNRIRFAR